MSRAARIQAISALEFGRSTEALELMVLAYILDPWGRWGTHTIGDLLKDIREHYRTQLSTKEQANAIANLYSRVLGRQGVFANIGHIVVDRTPHIQRLFSETLGMPTTSVA